MIYLEAKHLTRTYGEKVLFQDLNFVIEKGQKVALIARNGTGKSTMLRVIAGEEGSEGDNSQVLIHRDARLGYLSQEPSFPESWTVLEAALSGDSQMLKAVVEYEQALWDTNDEAGIRQATARMDELKAWDMDARAKEILFQLNIKDLDKLIGALSGGQVKRVAMANLIIQQPDFLILDEPTNHLDIDMLEWLEDYLSQTNLTLFMVTHDRYFLDRICSQILELEGGQLYKHRGGYTTYLQNKTLREDIQAATMERDTKLLGRELEWLRRQPKARTTKAKSRVDDYYDLKKKTTKIKEQREMKIAIKGERLGSKILEAQYISKSFGDHVLIKDFHYKFRKGEKVGVVGPNGVGKSTFIKVLTGIIKPTSGKVVTGVNTKFGYYSQEGMQVDGDKKVIDVIRNIAEVLPMEGGRDLTAEQLLERFMFPRKQQQVYVSQLSGGERRRLYLLTVLMANPNFLILDEPTNDLDILTLNVLEEFLETFPGCIIVVTHDRYFMDKIVDHLFVFRGQADIKDFNGTYSEYRLLKQLEESKKHQAEKNNTKVIKATAKSYENQKRIKNIEKEIERLHLQKSTLMEAFNNPDLSAEEAIDLSEKVAQLDSIIEEKEMKWIELSE